MQCDRLWRHARLLPLAAPETAMTVIDDGLIACRDGKIVYAGPARDCPANLDAAETIDCVNRLVTPGLIDCHTHLVYAGDRAPEFEQRLRGVSYEDIAKAGGGIASTMRATRAADDDTLLRQSLPRLDALLREGATTVEIKSGYGLSLDAERKQLRVAKALGQHRQVTICPTFLGAHALPPEYNGDRDAYIAHICDAMLPQIAAEGLADCVDGFCEIIGFTPDQIETLFDRATRHGLRVKLHADQLSNLGGAKLAARFNALSVDHIEYTDEDGVAAMQAAGTVAVLLPGAFYFIRETKLPPVELLRQYRVPMALATDCNPGTAPLTSLLLTMNMAATLFRLTVAECLLGVTRHAAMALGRGQDIGSLEAGKNCDLAIWDVDHPAQLVYRIGFNPLHARVWKGLCV